MRETGALFVQARILVNRNRKQELCVPVDESGAGIGRDSGNEEQLSMPEVSKRHAHLQGMQKGWRIQGLNSSNGLFVSGIKAREAFFKDGDRLTVGSYTLVFEIRKAAQPYKPVIQIDVAENASRQTMRARCATR